MRSSRLLGLTLTAAALVGCSDSPVPTQPGGGGGGPPPVLLKDMIVANLPSPYYHFEYAPSGQITRVSFASQFLDYSVRYQNARITELRDSAVGNFNRLEYHYDAVGRVDTVNYHDNSGALYARVLLTYSGSQLVRLDRERMLDTLGLVLEKTMTFSYYPDGNVQDIVDHRPEVAGRQADGTSVDHFEQYDDNVNVDAFGLIHNDFFDHIVLLPNVVLQKGNPARETFTSADIHYRFDYTYTFDGSKRPLTKGGTATVLSGPDSGQVIPLSTTFSYY